jgi:hypothetical protein
MQNSYDFTTSRQIKWPRASWQKGILETLEISDLQEGKQGRETVI